MASIKQERYSLEQLLNSVAPNTAMPGMTAIPQVAVNPASAPTVTPTPPPPPLQPVSPAAAAQMGRGFIDNTTGGIATPEMAFNFDYDGLRRGLRKKARKTIMNIIGHIIPSQYVEEEYILDKAEQDITSLTDLYMQLEVNNIMQRSLMESVSRGNSMPRMYEVFGQLSDKISSINKQIISTEQTLRKTYLDLKFEIHDKEAEEMNTKRIGTDTAAPAALPGPDDNVITSPKQLIEIAKRKHMEKLQSIQAAEYTVEPEN